MAYKVAVFDLDGTILNTLQDLTNAVNHALEKNGYPTRDIEEIRFFLGNGLKVLIDKAVPEGTSPEKTAQVLLDMTVYYKAHSMDFTAPYPGIIELLQKLRAAGVKTAVVSNKIDEAVQNLVKDLFTGLFDAALGESENIARKPAPDMTWHVLKKLGYETEDAVYIGDSDVDIQTARNSGLDEIIVDWGFRERKFLEEAGAKRIVSTTEEVYRIITE